MFFCHPHLGRFRNFIWINTPDVRAGAQNAENLKGGKPEPLDYDRFLQAMEKLPEAEKKELLKKAKDLGTNITPHSITTLRNGVLTPAQMEEDPEKSHVILAATYLKKKGADEFEVDLQVGKKNGSDDGDFAEYELGIGELFSRANDEISIWNNAHPPEFLGKASRDVGPNGREAYFYPDGTYAAVYTGYKVKVGKKLSGKELETKIKYLDDKHKARSSNKVNRTTFMGAGAISNALANFGKRAENITTPIESAEARENRLRMVAMAEEYAERAEKGDNPFKTDFEGKGEVPKGISLENGKLGCAWVASTFLYKFGYIEERFTRVDDLVPELKKRGFTELEPDEKPFPGCVVRWDPPLRSIMDPTGKKEWVRAKHPHVGIVTGPDRAVDNHGPDGPLKDSLYRFNNDGPPPTLRKMVILKPPDTVNPKKAMGLTQPVYSSINFQAPKEIQSVSSKPLNKIANRPTTDINEIATDHTTNLLKATINPDKINELKRLKETFQTNRAKYEEVAAATNMPAELICFIHWREASGDFGTYLHNGDPLGKPTENQPKGKLFHDWKSAAVDALKMHSHLQQKLGITRITRNIGQLAAYAEGYNGMGYRNKYQTLSPYVYAGTSLYSGGKYVADGKFDPNVVDKQLGAIAVLKTLFDETL